MQHLKCVLCSHRYSTINQKKYLCFATLLAGSLLLTILRRGLWCYSYFMLLAHQSQRLIGELIVYPWSVVVVRPSSTMLKHLLLRNRFADQSQILCGASLGRGNKILFGACGSHDQDGHHPYIWLKPFKNLLLRNWRADFHQTWYLASGTPAHHSLSNDDPLVTLTYFTARSDLVT